MAAMRALLLSLLSLASCADPEVCRLPAGEALSGDSAAGGDSGEGAACPLPDMTLVGSWEQAELPARADTKHTMQGVALGDLDGDGWLDALVAWGGGSFGLRNDGAGALVIDEAITGAEGPLSPAIAVALSDLDGDGDLDGMLGGWTDLVEVLWNDGAGRFTVEPVAGTLVDTFSIGFGDADGDGDLDAFVSAASDHMNFEEISTGLLVGDPNLLLLQDAAHHFTVAAGALPEDTLDGMTLHTAWLDAEGDGDLDLYVGNDAGPYIDPNLLLENDGAGHFSRRSDCGCEVAMFTMGVGVGDANQDGLPDLFATDVGPPALLQNLGGMAFADVTLASGANIPASPESMVSWGTAFVDLDQDMDQDIVVTFGQSGQNFDAASAEGEDGPTQPDQILLSDGVGGYSRAPAPGFQDGARTRAMAVGDLDRDGVPDLVTTGKYFLRQWRGVGSCAPGVTLRLSGSNLVGAKAEVTVGGVTRTTWHLPSTAASSNADELYLGFGGAPTAESIRLTWPGGAVTELFDVAAGGLIDLAQPSGAR